jgi:cytochrome P450
LHVPVYKNKTVAPHVDAWGKMVFFNPPGARHTKRRSAAYVALTAKDFDPTVRAIAKAGGVREKDREIDRKS